MDADDDRTYSYFAAYERDLRQAFESLPAVLEALFHDRPPDQIELSPAETAQVQWGTLLILFHHFADLAREVDRLRAVLGLYDDPSAS